MSRDNDRDRTDADAGAWTQCSDCGRDGIEGYLCDACADERDAHTSALELRLAKAMLPAIIRKDVA